MSSIQSRKTHIIANACSEPVVFEGSPYFLYETRKGVFQAVKSIVPTPDKQGRAIFDSDIGELVLGRDIGEIDCDLKVKIEVLKEDFMPYIINDLRGFARKCNEEYITYRTAGDSSQGFGNFYPTSNPRIAKIDLMPRVFVRAV
ncbi:MAG: hypothetical protein WC979_04535 [Candidatus Pacearchaeota archaeon]|jgi:hypothetical protein